MTKLIANAGMNGSWNDVGADYCPPFSGFNNALVMAANVAKNFTVPALQTKVFLNAYPAGTSFWANISTTATIPSGDITNGSASTLNPSGRSVTPGQTISVITATAGAIIIASFYD